MAFDTSISSWSLEVVRGGDVGQRYALGRGAVVLGNALNGEPGIDLSDLERTAPRKMAARQAKLDVQGGSLSIRDLDSPGGTFVNRQRILPGTSRALAEGDVLQLGGVQLRVVRGGDETRPADSMPISPAPRPQSWASGFVFTLKSGAACRSWDDFLAVSAQKWDDLRKEMTSGRLSGFLASIGRTDLAPDPNASGTPDDRLDAWIGRLPLARPASPELDVHPRSLAIRAPSGGGVTRRKITIRNTGYRVLRTTIRIEPEGTTWLTIGREVAGRTLDTLESTEVPIEATVPEAITGTMSATLIFTSNGGTATVAVRLEPALASVAEPVTKVRQESPGQREWVGRQSAIARWVLLPMVAIGGRMAIGIADRFLPVPGASPGLLGPLAMMAGLGGLLGLILSVREPRELPMSAIAGSILGAMCAAIFVAACRTVEPPFASLLGGWLPTSLLWGGIGAATVALSLIVAPPREKTEGGS